MAKSSKSKAAEKAKIEEAEIVEEASTPEEGPTPEPDVDSAPVDPAPETEAEIPSDMGPEEDVETPEVEQAADIEAEFEPDPDVYASKADDVEAEVPTGGAPDENTAAEGSEMPEGAATETTSDADNELVEARDEEGLADASQDPERDAAEGATVEGAEDRADDLSAPEMELDDSRIVSEEPSTAAPEPSPPPAAEKKSGGMFPLVLGGLIAAGIGYAVPTFVLNEPDPAVTALQGQVAALEASVSEVDTRAADAQSQAEATSAAMPDLAPLEQTASELASLIEALDTRIAALEARPVGESGITEGEFANLRAMLDEQQAASAALTAEMERMAALQAEGLANAETEALNAARAAQTAAALQTVRTAIDTGEPFDAALTVLDGPPDALTSVSMDGVATAESLQEVFPDLARAALNAARAEAAEGDAGGSILAFVQKQVGARSVTPREGDDPDAVLSRAEAAVRGGDWTAALTELSALPEVAQVELADWADQAQARADALSALSEFEAAN